LFVTAISVYEYAEENRTEQNLIVQIGTSETEVTIVIKDGA